MVIEVGRGAVLTPSFSKESRKLATFRTTNYFPIQGKKGPGYCTSPNLQGKLCFTNLLPHPSWQKLTTSLLHDNFLDFRLSLHGTFNVHLKCCIIMSRTIYRFVRAIRRWRILVFCKFRLIAEAGATGCRV